MAGYLSLCPESAKELINTSWIYLTLKLALVPICTGKEILLDLQAKFKNIIKKSITKNSIIMDCIYLFVPNQQ